MDSRVTIADADAAVTEIPTAAEPVPLPAGSEAGTTCAVSIVVPHLDASCLGACLASIFACGARRSFEVVVVADGSPAEDIRAIEAGHPDLRLVRLPQTQGFARACNAGAGAARGRYVLFLNDDTTVTPGWLDQLIDFVEDDPTIGLAGPKLLYPDGDRIQHCGTVLDANGNGLHIYRHVAGNAKQANRPRYYRAITGACIVIERELFLRLGGFDIRFHRSGGCEDTDLCFKVLEEGRMVGYCPASTVYHHEGVSRGVRDELHPEEVYNRKLLRERWAKYLTPDVAEYELLAEIESGEGRQWRWLSEVPAGALARKCLELDGERRRLVEERDRIVAERDAAFGEGERLSQQRAAAADALDRAAQERDAALAAGARLTGERDAAAAALLAEAAGRDRAEADLRREADRRAAVTAERDRAARERDAVAVALLQEARAGEAAAARYRRRFGARLRRWLAARSPSRWRRRIAVD